MTQYVKHVRFRKFSPVDREYRIFELVAGDEILLDVSVSDDGVPEAALHEASIGKIFKLDDLYAFLVQGKRLLEEEMAYESCAARNVIPGGPAGRSPLSPGPCLGRGKRHYRQ